MNSPDLASIKACLWTEFSALAKHLGADETTSQRWTSALISHYTEPRRHYHTIEHINSMLICCKRYHRELQDEQVVKLAIFFHDWIYDPQDKDNELRSIKCFQEFAYELDLPKATTTWVSKYIERTITHTLEINDGEADIDLRLFLDFDLEVLSRNSPDYALYAAQIRQEYSHLTESDYCNGRIKVLREFLERDQLYFSDIFYKMGEEIARNNLKGEIEVLEAKLDELNGGL
jgi:predicted metal-dependent HD superfamily phosphohydrolase